MTDNTLLIIHDNGVDAYSHPVLIGRYAYTCRQVGVYSVQVMRCKRDDLGRQWFDYSGNARDGWAPYGPAYIPAARCCRR